MGSSKNSGVLRALDGIQVDNEVKSKGSVSM